MSLQGKNIIVGICGSIAAYKSAYLTRLLIKAGANVRVVMTHDAKHFITPLTLSTLSNNKVLSDYYEPENGVWNNHVEVALWADVILIAPVTANTLAKLANGICDHILCAIYLSARCPVYLAPAMDLDMWAHESTRKNLQRLSSYGNHIISPGTGELASGLYGEGRMAEPEQILNLLREKFSGELPLLGRKALVTAGPTYEAIDPVRFIGNHSSGKMGFAIAEALKHGGAEVTLVSGPSAQATPQGVQRINITSSLEMYEACSAIFENMDITVMSAAVADYKPKSIAKNKIKKESSELNLPLEKTIDILATLGAKKSPKQLLIGFALETDDELANAKAKLIKKNLDFIVLNSLRDEGAGFSSDQNKITIISAASDKEMKFELKPKRAVAQDICDEIIAHLK